MLGDSPVSVSSGVAKQLALKQGQIIDNMAWVRIIKAETMDAIKYVERHVPTGKNRNGMHSRNVQTNSRRAPRCQ